MGILADWQIREEIWINPFSENFHRKGLISYGVSSYGYDVRVGTDFRVFTNVFGPVIDPKNFKQDAFVEWDATKYRDEEDRPYCIIPPNSFALAVTMEYLKIPKDILVICVGKSTYARCGIIVNVTPLEPCWEGTITMEISNTTPLPAKIYAGEGLAQLLFLRADKPDRPCEKSYADKNGKYQKQEKLTLPFVVK